MSGVWRLPKRVLRYTTRAGSVSDELFTPSFPRWRESMITLSSWAALLGRNLSPAFAAASSAARMTGTAALLSILTPTTGPGFRRSWLGHRACQVQLGVFPQLPIVFEDQFKVVIIFILAIVGLVILADFWAVLIDAAPIVVTKVSAVAMYHHVPGSFST